jgi:hypothetical protein
VRIPTAIVLVTALAAPAGAQPVQVMVSGIGRMSCASWLADSASEFEGSAWLLGFWTGANFWSDTHTVGASTDALGIIESAKKLCRDDPAATLATVASKLYRTFQQEGR